MNSLRAFASCRTCSILVPNLLTRLKFNNINNISRCQYQRGYVSQISILNKIQNRHYVRATNAVTQTENEDTDCKIKNVYYGVLTPQIRAVKIFSLTTSIAGVVAQPLLLSQAESIGGGLPVIIGLCTFVGFFTFVTPFLLHFITKKYITHLDYNSETEEYIATTINFFLVKQKTIFKCDEVEVPDLPGMFTTFKVKGRPLFVDPRLFHDSVHYVKIMGFDKPMDFKMETPDKQPKKEK